MAVVRTNPCHTPTDTDASTLGGQLLLFEPHQFCQNFVPGEVCFPLLLRLPLCHSASPRFLSGHTFFTLRLPNPHVPVLRDPLRQTREVACLADQLLSAL